MTDRSATYPSLAGTSVLVTGGATGIGADIVRAFAGQGARVGFVDRQTAPAHALVAELAPGAVHFAECDVRDLAALKAAIDRLALLAGPFTVLVNNAADDTRHALADVTPADWDANMAVNLRPQFFAAQAVAPMMTAAGGGSIINLSSIAWRFGADSFPVYGTAKAAIVGLTNALARALGPKNIRVNAIEPGAVMTPRQRELWYQTDESVQVMLDRQMIRRTLVGQDIARMALFLASDEAQMITKQSIAVDAGIY